MWNSRRCAERSAGACARKKGVVMSNKMHFNLDARVQIA